MKRVIYIAAAAATLASCVGDLDTLPLNRTEPISEYVYGADENAYLSGLSRLYFQFVSNDLTDLQSMDGGASEIIRAFWSVQETTTDEAKCSWENDAWVRALNTNTWSEVQNDAIYAVYVRTLQGIAYVNEYLRQTEPERLADRGVSATLASKIETFRAEARFIRAYLYWMALDCFGSVPFTTEDSPFGGAYFPKQASRTAIFNYCVSELEYLRSEASPMPPARSAYPRADKGAAAGLLARMYLNSNVYTGVPMWAEAKAVCEAVFYSMVINGYSTAVKIPATVRERLLTAPVRSDNSLALAVPITWAAVPSATPCATGCVIRNNLHSGIQRMLPRMPVMAITAVVIATSPPV